MGFLSVAFSAKAAELVGLTRDAVSENGISSVKVKLLTSEAKLYKNAISDGSGKYRIKNIEPGHYRVFFEKTGFSATPQGASIDLNEKDTKVENATLYEKNPDAAYVIALAGKIKERARQCPSTVTGYENEWRTIEYSEITPQFKIKLANELKQQDVEATKVEAIKNLVKDYNILDSKPPKKDLQKPLYDVPHSLNINSPSNSNAKPTTYLPK